MGVIKKIILLLSFLFGLSCYAQQNPVIFAGVENFRNTGFEHNSFGNLHVGVRAFQWKFIAQNWLFIIPKEISEIRTNLIRKITMLFP